MNLIPDISCTIVLLNIIEIRKLKQIEVARGTGISPTVISDVLNQKRLLNHKQIELLATYFGIEPMVFYSFRGPTCVSSTG